MSRDLMSQINSRADSMRNISDMANDSRGGFFGDFKNTISNDYQGALEDYADKLNVDVSKEISQRSEGFSILSQTPILFSSGKSMYNSLGDRGKQPFDYVGQKVKDRFGDTIDRVSGKYNEAMESVDSQIQNFQSNIKNFPDHIRSVMNGAKDDSSLVNETDGVKSVNLLEADKRGIGDQSINQMEGYQEPKPKTLEELQKPDDRVAEPTDSDLDDGSDIEDDIQTEPKPTEPTEVTKSTEVAKPTGEDDMPPLEDIPTNVETKTDSGSYQIGKSNPSAEEDDEKLKATEGGDAEGVEEASSLTKDLGGAAEVDEEIGAAGGELGEAVAGVGLAVIGVVAGLSTLFGHHSHHPNRPTYNATQPAFQSRYNPSASVLANVNNTTTQATTSF